MQLWRLFPERFSSTAFTGTGSLYAAGRWNHLGVFMIYTATSRALAALEFFVNLDPSEAPDDLLLAEAIVPDEWIERLNIELLPANWRELNNTECRDLGSQWASSNRSVGLQVPSAVVDGDWNVLLNPKHPDFNKVRIAAPKPFHYDERMFQQR
ncbi:MAG TPA: RES family NAD+ phosphorylase [Pseudacidobacterium sp.]|jgi:RES domain-containing protein|nr:RES family NAD+ phosphorylase [Pseudacidobacterium sp.]